MQDKVNQSLRFLVFKAHPHDFTHCAGTCGIHAAQGDSITVVSMTNGVGTHNEKPSRRAAQGGGGARSPDPQPDRGGLRSGQGEGVSGRYVPFSGQTDMRILDFPDKPFHKTPEAVEALRQIIYDVRPHVLITQRPHLSGRYGMASAAHNDHDETAFAILGGTGVGGNAGLR